MAQVSRLTLDEVRASVRRMQAEGERLVGRIREDARTLVERPNVRRLREDVRQRAEQALKELREQRSRLAGAAEQALSRAAALVVRALRVPTVEQLAEVNRRLAEIERRLDEISSRAA
jgi:replicative DNA helicase